MVSSSITSDTKIENLRVADEEFENQGDDKIGQDMKSEKRLIFSWPKALEPFRKLGRKRILIVKIACNGTLPFFPVMNSTCPLLFAWLKKNVFQH